ncbi:oxidoreductase [Prauserella marina]|uniref:NAD(P)-dependent dehydrogenase, short-chain alcohol dehydrogenase family n=1 Tax=Prauserella marina TaxID=530584 RepID=A0A222VWT1_9PSEU|nr:3-oxoacyl-ACP reductase family protein [Prauserella marina]ASR38388.1 oxidoreductase [Prauserella marina]PWV78385.1 NAD(P)-dependent dehydrogenase (short-subunit alcohol dehydrogenase family) [Prauserella marina]SDC84831.1 NAD(P)-dependent dehydrogenase, short-chain alcohol dehydrogenase family [Prauserella marina]
MNEKLAGKVALVTGGSRGIGAATALRLAAEGADVALTYVNSAGLAEEIAERIKAGGTRALPIRADSAQPDEVEAAVEATVAEFGRIDIVVNNAGVFTTGALDDLDVEDFDKAFAVNVRAPFVTVRTAARHLEQGGRVINIGSNVGERVPFPGFSIYSATKAALIGMTKALARELGQRGITVNMVSPGPTDTDANPAGGPMAAVLTGHTALGRFGQPEDVAAAVAYLASDDAGNLAGATINVDGGFNI